MAKTKRILKIFLCLLCTLSVFTGSVGFVSADYNDVMFDLTSLNILEGLAVNEDVNANITRAEFSQLVVNLLGYREIAMSHDDPGVFSDISENPYKGAINLLYDLNIISGTGVNTFSPDGNLTYPQVGKFIVNVLGYSNIVKSTDLYAYFMLAGSIGTYENIDSTEGFVTWYDALVIAHNALDIDIMTKDFAMIGDTYHIIEGNTIRSSLTTTSGENVKKLRGVVTADYATYLYESRTNFKPDQVEINGKIYNCNFNVPYGLVGLEVDFYVSVSKDGEETVTSINPTNKNTVVSFNLDMLESASDGAVKYRINDDKTEKIKVDASAKVIYNDRWVKSMVYTDISAFENGYVSFIDNDEDAIYDYVFAYEYTDAIIERIFSETKQVYFDNNQLVYGARYVSFDAEEDDLIIKLRDAEGKAVDFEALTEGTIISIAKSKDGQVINAVVSDKKVTGVVNEIDDYSITIGSDVFDYVTKPDVSIGFHVDAYVNFMNKVFYVEKTKAENTFAYVLDAQQKSGIDGTVKISLILPGYISETSIESFDEEGTADSSKELFFRNNSKVVFELSSKVRINNSTVKAQDAISLIKGKVVSYGLGAGDKVNKLEILDVFNDDSAKKAYNQNGKTFSSKAKEGFGITESTTMSICIPTNTDASDDDLLVPVKLVHGSEYSINAYDVDEMSSIAGLAVINAEMRSGISGSVSPATSNIAVLEKVSYTLDDEGNELLRVHMLTKDGKKSYVVSPLMSSTVNNRFLSMKKGDIFFYETIAGTDELRNCQLLHSIDNYDVTGVYNIDQINEICLGEVSSCRYNYVSAKFNRWTDCLTINCGSDQRSYEIFKTGTPIIFLIDESGNAELGTFDDIQCGNHIYVGAVYSNVRVLAVRK